MYNMRSIFSPRGGSSGVLPRRADSWARVGVVGCVVVLMTAIRKSGGGGADFFTAVEGL